MQAASLLSVTPSSASHALHAYIAYNYTTDRYTSGYIYDISTLKKPPRENPRKTPLRNANNSVYHQLTI